MPQLSPMSWVFVFVVLLFFLLLFAVMVWWSVGGEYKVVFGPKVGGVGKNVYFMGWGFGKKIGLLTSKKS